MVLHFNRFTFWQFYIWKFYIWWFYILTDLHLTALHLMVLHLIVLHLMFLNLMVLISGLSQERPIWPTVGNAGLVGVGGGDDRQPASSRFPL